MIIGFFITYVCTLFFIVTDELNNVKNKLSIACYSVSVFCYLLILLCSKEKLNYLAGATMLLLVMVGCIGARAYAVATMQAVLIAITIFLGILF